MVFGAKSVGYNKCTIYHYKVLKMSKGYIEGIFPFINLSDADRVVSFVEV